MAKKSSYEGWGWAAIILGTLAAFAGTIVVAAENPEAAGAFIGAASKASKPRPVKKTRYDGLFSSYTVTEYW